MSIGDVLLNSLWAMIAGFVGSIIILIIVFLTSSMIDVPWTFSQARLGGDTNPMFPFVLSFITFIATMISLMLSVSILHMTDPEKYKKNRVIYSQMGIFGIVVYTCITPIYIFTGLISYDNIMIVFIVHVMILSFGSSLLLEILNNYRYILTGFYGSFVGLFWASIFVISLFASMESGYVKLISLLIILPVITTLVTFFKGMFEILYYNYNRLTNVDPLGDIFHAIEQEAQEALREAEEKNSI